jgi:FtsH-binding integral membrane protein
LPETDKEVNRPELARKLAFGALVSAGIATAIAYLPPPADGAARHLPFKAVGVLVLVALVLSVAAAVAQKRSGAPMTRLVRLALGVGLFFSLLFVFFALFVVDLAKLT